MSSQDSAWTGAVGEKHFSDAPASWAKDVVSGLLAGPQNSGAHLMDVIELLLYVEQEWGDEKAGAAARAAFKGLPPQALLDPLIAPRAAAISGDAPRLLAAQSSLASLKSRPQSLNEAAARISALCDLFQMTAKLEHRAAADALAQALFQDLWDRERGGFLSWAPQNGEVAPPMDLEMNAAAFAAIWRLNHITGNPSYRRWLAWGIKGLAADARALPVARQAGLARVADMMMRGRLYLEIVGRPEEEKARELVLAAYGRYCPRRVVSWISPDDRDYVMAHKLEAPSFPALFACADLKPVGWAVKPADVPALFKRLLPLCP